MTTIPDPAARLVEADREAARARRQVSMTVEALQARLSPDRLVGKARREAQAVGQVSAQAASRYGGLLAGVLAALGLFAIGRRVRRRPARIVAAPSDDTPS